MITIKQHDTGIGIKATLRNEDGAIDLNDASVLFYMGDFVIHPHMTDRENGVVTVVFDYPYTSKSGTYRAEFKVKYSDGRVESFPNDEYLRVKIMQDLGGTQHGR